MCLMVDIRDSGTVYLVLLVGENDDRLEWPR